MNSMLEHLSDDLGFDKNVGGAVAAAILFLCTGVGGLLADFVERLLKEYTQMIIGLFYLAGNILCVLATSHKICWTGPAAGCVADMILCGRLLTGCASAMALVLSPRYLAEVSPVRTRGALLSGLQLCGTGGILMGLLVGTPYDYGSVDMGYEWWRIMFLFSGIPACAQVLLACMVLRLYRMPRKELQVKFEADAMGASLLEEKTEIPSEQLMCVDDKASVTASGSKWQRAKRTAAALLSRKYRHCVVLGLGVPIAAHSSGANIILSYSTTILKDAGFNRPVLGGCIMGIAFVLITAMSALLFDRTGRKTLARISFAGMAVSCLGLGLSNLAGEQISSFLSVAFVLSFISSFSIGAGTLNMTYAAEVSPSELSGTILGLGQLLKSGVTVLLVLCFPSALHVCGALLTFTFLSILNLSSFVFVTWIMVETKGRSLDDIVSELTTTHR